MTRRRPIASLALAGALLVPAIARAQDAEPDPEEVKKKIVEIEKLMKGAEEALARSTDTRSAAERSAEAAKKLLDQKAREETGKSAEDLRKEAENGSQQAKETLERLTKAAQKEAEDAAKKLTEILGGNGGGASGGSGGSSAGIKELIEKIKGDGKGASERMEWLLKLTRPGQGRSQPRPDQSGQPDKQENKPDPQKPDKKKPEEKKPESSQKKPESKTEPPRSPEFVQWVAELPPQVRRAVESQDWDSIPPKWREMLRDWTKKMAEESEKESR
jgi:hypothetical protein